MTTPSTIRVVIPLKVKRRNGRPRIVPPDEGAAGEPNAQQPHVLRAIARAWAWRRMLERGEVPPPRRSRDALSAACSDLPICRRPYWSDC